MEQRIIDIEESLEDVDERLSRVEEALAASLSSKLAQNRFECEECGEPFYARKGAKYCSVACRQSAYRGRKEWE